MAPLPVDVLLGIYLGILTGILPALVAFALGFLFRYVTGITIPAFAVVVLGVAIAGVNGGLLALVDPTIISSTAAPTLVPALVVVLMITLYAHHKGDELGMRVPRRVTFHGLRERTLSADVVRRVGDRGRVRLRIAGDIGDVEGYPPLPDDVRREIREREWIFETAPLPALESTFADRLRSEFDLADVQVEIDERARATVRAAPPLSGLSKHVSTGRRAVAIDTLVPTGIARGDEVTVRTPSGSVQGTIVSVPDAKSAAPTATDSAPGPEATGANSVSAEAGMDDAALPAPGPSTVRAQTTAGGEGRLAISVPRAEARSLLGADDPMVVVRSRGTHKEFELVSLLRLVGLRFQKISVGEAVGGATLAELDLREVYGVAVLAVRRPDGWTVAPRGTARINTGDEVFAVGEREALNRVTEALA